MKKSNIIGVDFGGTKIKAGVISLAGKLVGRPVSKPTRAARPAKEILADMVAVAREAAAAVPLASIAGVGIGSPGPLDLKRGKIIESPNLPTMHNFPLQARLKTALKLPVFINNDANCFVLGESYFGAGRRCRYVYGVTLGTGFGNGLVLDGRIFSGATGTATEMARTPYLDMTQEDYISGRGVSMLYRRLTGKSPSSLEVYQQAQEGKKQALECWQQFGLHLGRILAGVVNLLDPDVIVVGGSIAAAWDFFQPALQQHLSSNIYEAPRRHLRLQRAALGEHSGLYGAACLVLQEKVHD